MDCHRLQQVHQHRRPSAPSSHLRLGASCRRGLAGAWRQAALAESGLVAAGAFLHFVGGCSTADHTYRPPAYCAPERASPVGDPAALVKVASAASERCVHAGLEEGMEASVGFYRAAERGFIRNEFRFRKRTFLESIHLYRCCN